MKMYKIRPKQFSPAFSASDMLTFKFLIFKSQFKVMEYNFRYEDIRLQVPNLQKSQVVVAVSVEALAFIVSCSDGCGFDSHCRPGSFLRFNSRPIMYGAVGSLILSWSWSLKPGFISFWCLWIQLCNNLQQRLCAYNLPQLIKLSILSGMVPVISRG